MKHNLSIPTMMAMIRSIERYGPADFDVLGIPPENFEILTQADTWRYEHREIITRTFTAIVFGNVKIMGLPPIVLPSEFLAAVVATLIAPENQMHCCIWLAQERMTGKAAIELAARNEAPSQWDPTSGDALFALVCLAADTDETNWARKRFLERLGLRVQEAERKTV